MDIVVRRDGAIHVANWGAGLRPCAVGRSGIAEKMREGDGVTPAGCWPLRRVLYRADRMGAPSTGLALAKIDPGDAWCDVPGDPDYNRQVRLPHPGITERLWREDSLYDLIVVVGFNDSPVLPGKGSAIFLHVASADYGATEGCVAFARDDLIEAVRQVRSTDRLVIRA
jgi:L,D-peptidoglycan transpeptidase YkuD (ErfK/YbiS/YcfS/YnhG family)